MNSLIGKITAYLANHWQGILTGVAMAGLATTTLGLHYNNLLPGQNQYETTTLNNLQTLPAPWHRTVNALYNLPAYYISHMTHSPLNSARLISVLFGFLAVICFFYIIKLWFNTRIATVGSLLFITSSWLLHVSRQATPQTLLILGPLLILLALAWYLKTKRYKTLSFYFLAAVLGVTAYVPFMPWLIIMTLLILIKKESKQLATLKIRQIILAAILYLLIMSPLLISLLSFPGQLRNLLAIPAKLPTVSLYFNHFYHTLAMIAVRSATMPTLHLGHLPMLDIFSAAMFVLGVFYYIKRLPKSRSVVLLTSLSVLLLVLPLSSNYQLNATVLMPLIYICLVAGIIELLNQWFLYFPRNPLARNIGIALIVIAIGFTSYYNLQNYFIAWPKTPQTQAVYMVKLK